MHSAIVVNSSVPLTNSSLIHRQLGHKLAESICQTPDGFFEEGDIIGVGSGRAIHYLVDSFRSFRKFNVSDVTLMSLTGTVYPEVSITLREQLLDSDINTVEFAKFFKQATTVRTISFPIALPDVPSVRCNTWLHESDNPKDSFAGNLFRSHVPTHAFIGVGVLAENHRLFREVQQAGIPTSTMLNPIRENLRELITISQNINDRNKTSRSEYYPIADICHRLFYIDPPHDIRTLQNETNDIDRLIKDINTHMLTITKTQLCQIKKVVLIAGTSEKLLAIQRLLERNIPAKNPKKLVPVVKTICVDAPTAQKLVNAK